MQETNIQYAVADIMGRLKVVETKLSNVNERVQLTTQNMIEINKESVKDSNYLIDEVRKLKKEIFDIKTALKQMVQETEDFARKSDLKVLEKYINMWNPLNFTTVKDVEKIINEKRGNK